MLRVLVAAEVGMALVLLVGAGLLVRAFQHLQQGGLGFEPDHVLTARLILPDYRYSEPGRIVALHDGVLARLRALPGVLAAGSVAMLPLSGWEAATTFQLEGQPPAERGHEPEADLQWIDDGYLAAARIPLLAGRTFDERDRRTTPDVALVNAAFVRRFLGGAVPAAVGRRLVFADRAAGRAQARPREIVGVLGDVRHLGFEEPAAATVYVPSSQDPVPVLCLTVRTRTDPASLAPALRQAVWSQDPEQPVSYVMTYDQLAAESLTLRRLSALLAAAFAAIALGLAALGAYGVVAQVVGSGRREIGVRLALGASPTGVVGSVIRQALGASAIGALAGLVAAAVVARLLRGLLFGVAPLDPLALCGATALLLATAGLAAWLPARRAAQVDPAVVLRDE